MHKLFSLALTLASTAALAAEPTTFVTRIHDVIAPEGEQTAFRILTTGDGEVLELAPAQIDSIDTVIFAAQAGTVVRLTLDGDKILEATHAATSELPATQDLFTVQSEGAESEISVESLSETTPYEPTRLASLDEAKQIFNSMEHINPSSQCYQRAMLWTHTLHRTRGLKSMKVFLFFTRKYIREFNYKWWFHVTPYVMVGEEEITLDRTFTDGPLTMRAWTDEFMHNHALCPVAEKYSDYRDHQEQAYCYLRKVPMYYYTPLHIEQTEERGETVTGFNPGDLGHAARARTCRRRRCA